jgi:hypothetical protein
MPIVIGNPFNEEADEEEEDEERMKKLDIQYLNR